MDGALRQRVEWLAVRNPGTCLVSSRNFSTLKLMLPTCCPNCHAPVARQFTARDWNRATTDETFTYKVCGACGLIFIATIPPDLGPYYPPSYYPVPKDLTELTDGAALETYKVEILSRHMAVGSLLEIGGSYGIFANLAKMAGFEVSVIEMDARCCEFLRDIVKVKSVQLSEDPAAVMRTDSRRYDVITLWHVIEHLPDPWTVLAEAADRLAPGGILVMAAPNPESFQFLVQGRRWMHVDAPRHLWLIPIKVLEVHLAKHGLRLIDSTTNDAGSQHWSRAAWDAWLTRFASGRKMKGWMHRLARISTRLAAPFESRDKRGSAYTLVFKKTGADLTNSDHQGS